MQVWEPALIGPSTVSLGKIAMAQSKTNRRNSHNGLSEEVATDLDCLHSIIACLKPASEHGGKQALMRLSLADDRETLSTAANLALSRIDAVNRQC